MRLGKKKTGTRGQIISLHCHSRPYRFYSYFFSEPVAIGNFGLGIGRQNEKKEGKCISIVQTTVCLGSRVATDTISCWMDCLITEPRDNLGFIWVPSEISQRILSSPFLNHHSTLWSYQSNPWPVLLCSRTVNHSPLENKFYHDTLFSVSSHCLEQGLNVVEEKQIFNASCEERLSYRTMKVWTQENVQ